MKNRRFFIVQEIFKWQRKEALRTLEGLGDGLEGVLYMPDDSMPDIFLPYPISGMHGLFIFVADFRDKFEESQIKNLANLRDRGYHTVICYSTKEATRVIADYTKGIETNPNQHSTVDNAIEKAMAEL